VITNERQYRITKAEAQRFTDALAQSDDTASQLHPRIRQAMREGAESQLEELREQIAEYEALRDGRVTVLELDSLGDLPSALIRARIAAHLTQKGLAQRLGIKEQQIQRYEATQYAGATFERLQAVAGALDVRVDQRVFLPAQAGEVATSDGDLEPTSTPG
jgi:ribosome-binding protein aMBF1 (putative translation factor)